MTHDLGARDSRAHRFPSGLRQRLRGAVKASGATTTFRTDLRRDGRLVVVGVAPATAPFSVFEGHDVVWLDRSNQGK